ncbi:MAG: glutathione S-transferase family protein [Gammaproteobacteria bacterium]|nr:glutathione S-transferase family protein [Gammaproteobacteria bacterium]
MKLVIGNKNYSSWSLRPWLLLRQIGIGFEEIQVSLRTEGLSERLRQYSPSGKVPVLLDRGLTIWDSLAICEYVSEQYLSGKGWPQDPGQRAEARSVSAEMHSGFTALRSEMPMNCRARRTVNISDAARRDIDRIEQIWSTCLDKNSGEGPWLFGGFSIADCMYAPVVLRFVTYGIHTSELNRNYLNTVAGNKHLLEWLAAAKTETEILAVNETGSDIAV